MKKRIITAILIVVILNGLIITSCQDDLTLEKSLRQELISEFDASIFSSHLDRYFQWQYDRIEFGEDNSINQTLFIPVKLKEENSSNARVHSYKEHYVIPIFNADNKIIGVSSVSGNNLLSGANDYTGKIIQQVFDLSLKEPLSIAITFQRGKVIKVDGTSNLQGPTLANLTSAARTTGESKGCGSYRDVLYCTGKKFENAQCCFEEAACYIAFIYCYFQRQADCWINGC